MRKNLLMLFVFLIPGCASIETREVNCHIPQGKILAEALIKSRQTLIQGSCHDQYKKHFDALIDIAGGNPKSANLDTLGQYAQWMVQQEILTNRESEKLLRHYFSPKLVSLDYADFNESQCSLASKQQHIFRLLEQEMTQKKRGILEALGDKKSYQSAMKEHQSIILVLNNILQACHQL